LITANQTPEQLVRDQIDNPGPLREGWQVRSKKHITLTIDPPNKDATILARSDKTVNKNFPDWIFKKQPGPRKYTTEQVQWVRMIKDCIANSFHVDRDHFELGPLNKQGGLGKMWQLGGEETDGIIGLN
jgi:hypothetical protein